MTQLTVGRNPLFLRDEELERALELLLLAEREIASRTDGVRDRLGLSELDFGILYLVQRHPGTTTAELCGILGSNKQSLSRHVRQLVELGLLSQADVSADRRKRPLAVTDRGADRLAEIGGINKRRLRRAFMSAGPEAVDGFQRVLHELIDGPGRRWAARKAA